MRRWMRIVSMAVAGLAAYRRFRARRSKRREIEQRVVDSAPADPTGTDRRGRDEVEVAGDDSFPASDPPSWTRG